MQKTQVYAGTVSNPSPDPIDLDTLGFLPVVRTKPDFAVKMEHPFVIYGPLGTRHGDAGDYLVRGHDGSLYPHPASEFEAEFATGDAAHVQQVTFDHEVVAMNGIDGDGHFITARLLPQDAINAGRGLVEAGERALAKGAGE